MNAPRRLTIRALFLTMALGTSTISSAQDAEKSLSNPAFSAPAGAEAEVPSIKFDVVSFRHCERLDLNRKGTILGGDSIGRHCQSMLALFDYAYGFAGPYQVKGEPQWVDTEPWDFQAKIAPGDVPAWLRTDRVAKALMVRAMLATILNLKVHIETQPIPVYNLVVAKSGLKLTESKPDPNAPVGAANPIAGDSNWISPDEAIYRGATMQFLANGLAARLDRNVVDKTGLTGIYDFHVKPLPFRHYDPKSSDVETTDFAGIIDGVKSLGLRLEPGKAETSVIVVDHIDRPPPD